jgi:2-keto-4-pentenoate hydratase/2-oxohepta-3-ene-1,7-dioic acid hydratase in catechol pathway
MVPGSRGIPHRRPSDETGFYEERRIKLKQPSKIVCVGRNYTEHAAELGNVVPERPLLFLKPPSALIGDGEEIVLPEASSRVEHEGEIGVVVGTRLRHARKEAALAAIGGLTCVNDVTARDLQKTDGQWTRAKGFDTFCPVGPHVVPLDELHGRAVDMAFGIPMLLSYISNIMTLEPGDIVSTGTPSGVGPLAPGDRVEVEIPGVGVLANTVTSGS